MLAANGVPDFPGAPLKWKALRRAEADNSHRAALALGVAQRKGGIDGIESSCNWDPIRFEVEKTRLRLSMSLR